MSEAGGCEEGRGDGCGEGRHVRQCIEGKWCGEWLMRGKVEVCEEWKSGWKERVRRPRWMRKVEGKGCGEWKWN